MSGDIRQQQAADSSGGAARCVVDVPAALGLAEGFAVNPSVQSSHFNAARGELAVTPDFHAGHVLRLRFAHEFIIPGEMVGRMIDCPVLGPSTDGAI